MKDDLTRQFIVDESDTRRNTQELIKKVLKFGKVSKTGDIIIEDRSLSKDNILKLALVVRFLAHSLDESIPESIRPSDLTKVMSERIEAVGSRLSVLVKSNFAKKDGYGKYVVHHYKIEKFLAELEYGNVADDPDKTDQNKRGRKIKISQKRGRPVYGVGADIQNLIDSGFFRTPKFVADVKKKLEEEVKFHDVRVIDTAIRKTFIINKKLLKRIPNTEKGKAKWKYVVRS